MAVRGTYGLMMGKPASQLRAAFLEKTAPGLLPKKEEPEGPSEKVKAAMALRARKASQRAQEQVKREKDRRRKEKERAARFLDSDSEEEEAGADDSNADEDRPSSPATGSPSNKGKPNKGKQAPATPPPDPMAEFLSSHLPSHAPSSPLFADPAVRAAAVARLLAYHKQACARTIQRAYRAWTSRQMVAGWVHFSRMSVENQGAGEGPEKMSSADKKKHVRAHAERSEGG
jgi:hypothetical protein